MTRVEAAHILGLSERQVYRRLKAYRKDGPAGLAHRNRGRPSNRALSQELKIHAIKLCITKYVGYGPTLASEKLLENDGIKIDHEVLRKLMISKGIREETKRKLNVHVWRERKHHFGEMGQLDASKHLWFSDEQYVHLLAWIDDATGRVELVFREEETTEGYVALTKSYLRKYGRTRSIYTDRGKAFKVNNGKDIRFNKTQYQRILAELNIDITHARSPQAKGRVERLFRTLQDRLVKELAFKGIKDIESANQFLQNDFIDAFNKRFTVAAKSDVDVHQSVEGLDLNPIFCLKFQRTLNNDYTIVYHNRWFQLAKKQPISLYRGSKITVLCHFDGTTELRARGHRLNCKEIAKPIKQPVQREERI